ncbi:hypothetical protein CU098_004343 [Rhizopus stolonifer]|uniref:Uncharacterized protein n=1 Tax=Rhizopus stolonifer TaxID=4846 RepID=A0A367ILJ9_RHIST|nr:hypothetical protein CU098_004343 [Rhizopus stolonifer]
MPSFTSFPRDPTKWGPSDWTKQKEEDDQLAIIEKPIKSIQPRFSVFGNRQSKLATINSKRYETKPVKEEEETQTIKKKKVTFDPIYLERVCLFNESQSPVELQQALPLWPCTEKKSIMLDHTCFSMQDRYIKEQMIPMDIPMDVCFMC